MCAYACVHVKSAVFDQKGVINFQMYLIHTFFCTRKKNSLQSCSFIHLANECHSFIHAHVYLQLRNFALNLLSMLPYPHIGSSINDVRSLRYCGFSCWQNLPAGLCIASLSDAMSKNTWMMKSLLPVHQPKFLPIDSFKWNANTSQRRHKNRQKDIVNVNTAHNILYIFPLKIDNRICQTFIEVRTQRRKKSNNNSNLNCIQFGASLLGALTVF